MAARKLWKTPEIAKIFGVSDRRVQQLTQSGVISQKGGKGYDLIPTVTGYIAHLKEEAKGVACKKEMRDLEKEKLIAEIDLKRSKAETAKLELAEFEGTMHRAEDVEAVMTDLVLYMRSMLLSLPGRLAVDVAAMSNAAEVSDAIRKEVCAILTELTRYQYDPAEYAKRVRER